MRKRIGRPSPALVISCVALFVALGGVGYAAATINGSSLVNKSVAGKKLKNKTVTGGKVANNTLTGAQINESKLGKVPSATRADSAAKADTATTAGTAGSAGTATLANSIADDTVTGQKVVAGSLTAADVGRKAGTSTISVGNINANVCSEILANIDPTDTNMTNDAFAITAEDTWPTGLVFSTENSNSNGFVRINVCNVTGAPINAGNQIFHWVAFAE